MASDQPAAAAAVFTRNRVKAAPVQLSRRHLRRAAAHARAVVVNAGNANCCTGPEGLTAARRTATQVARLLDCRPEEVLVCSTGVIGVTLPVEKILTALPSLVPRRSATPQMFNKITRAIMTTDTRPKWAAARYRVGRKTVRLLGCAKGAGMIAPNMATMLGFIFTDAALSPPSLQRALREAVAATFNRITVDGDTSTNDTVILLANGACGAGRVRSTSHNYQRFQSALASVCQKLALAIVADGEGARRVIEVEVHGAPSAGRAEKVARTIANSLLVKTACAGGDPNWGRIMAAAGRAGIRLDPKRVRVRLAGLEVFNGRPVDFNERAAHGKLSADRIPIVVDLGSGKERATVWTCDLTADYVRVNTSYRS